MVTSSFTIVLSKLRKSSHQIVHNVESDGRLHLCFEILKGKSLVGRREIKTGIPLWSS